MDDNGECVFCRIISGEIPANVIFEDDRCIAILDAFPVCEGHALILLRQHRRNVLDAEAEDLAAMMCAAKRIAPAIVKATGSDGFNLICNNESSAGQIVPHIHFHIIPRKDNDGLASPWKQTQYKQGRAEEVCNSIRTLLQ